MNNVKRSKILLATFLLAGAVVTLFSFYPKNDKLFSIAKNLDIFASLIRELDSYYVDEIDPDELVTVGINAMLAELDPYTEYIPEEDSDDFRMMTTGEYGGVGAVIGNRLGINMILMPYEGFPAQRAGLRVADELLRVDTVQVVDKNTGEISTLLKGPANTEVEVEVKRGEDTLTFNLTRKKIVISNVPYHGMVDEETGYIKLSDFTTNASTDVIQAVQALKANGATKLILDVRDNPGGILKEAVKIVNIFIPKRREVVKTLGKLESVNATYATELSPIDKDIPLVVMINERSASAAEIVAGALQDYDRAVLVGRKSFGKGLVQSTVPLSYNSQVKLTTAKYYIPSGRCIQAIDYSLKDEEGNGKSVPDSLRIAFKTKNGRTVFDGAGIEPDVEVDSRSFAPITYSLVTRSLIFRFANEFALSCESIPAAREFEVSEELYHEFVEWLQDKEYDYVTRVEKTIEDLERYAEREKYFEEIRDELASLKERVTHSKEQDLITFKEEIKDALKDEIVSRYYYQQGIIEASLDTDAELTKAVEILGDTELYAQILSPKLRE
ncbi:C-terminal processing peptidase-3. Serine peptidase. MEROPS family S41A [Cyclobacterium xiamenense]|uniref:C-terminal processing peptidase-3. Serine peptidase. MEROPS family S41A n=1 Tax=Cyclobacterium xiamenense TaxID=1297121 RepID=A0A1H6VHN8_9BACT|nr:S41 family peptidase [Cyclobacterium xiamenense]SEJ02484.1 C-terminal processing peptidase-3. Serine peptidase. MEROPS family S41A [Cyclobacterium xiamenense]